MRGHGATDRLNLDTREYCADDPIGQPSAPTARPLPTGAAAIHQSHSIAGALWPDKSGTRERLRFSYLRFLTRACSFSLQVSGRTSDTNPSVISLLKARSFSKRLRPWRSAAVRNGTFEDSSSSSSCRWRRPSPLGMTPHRHSDAKQAPDQ